MKLSNASPNGSLPVSAPLSKGRLSLYLWLGITTTILLQLSIRLSGHISHDVAWYLVSVGRMLDGAVLYKDIIEVNPPLAFWLMSPPVAFHRLTNIDVIVSVYLYVFALILFSSVLVDRVLALRPAMQNSHRALIVWMVAMCCAFIPGSDFAQREHLMVILLAPYLALATVRLDGDKLSPRLAVFVGVVAATGLCLKPHMMAIPLAIELYIIARRHDLSLLFRPETLAIAATILIYIVAVATVTPDYLSTIAPMAVDTYASTYRLATSTYTARIEALVAGILLVVLARVLLAKQDSLTGILLAACVGAVFSYAAQQKGFRYHMLPAYVLVVLASGTLFLSAIFEKGTGGRLYSRKLSRALLSITILATVFATGISNAWEHRHYRYHGLIIHLLDQYAPHAESVFVASAHLPITFPAVIERNITWASRFPAQWLIPGIAIARHEAEQRNDSSLVNRNIENFARNSAVEDFLHFKPDMVVFDIREKKNYFGNAKLDYLSFYKEDKRFVQFWTNYKKVSTIDNFDIYCRIRPNHDQLAELTIYK